MRVSRIIGWSCTLLVASACTAPPLQEGDSNLGASLAQPTADELRAAAWRTLLVRFASEHERSFLSSERFSLHDRSSILWFLLVADRDGVHTTTDLEGAITPAELEQLTDGLLARIQRQYPDWQWASVADMVLEEREDPPLRALAPRATRIQWAEGRIRQDAFLHSYSQMGFNEGLTEAVVYEFVQCGPKCAQGAVILLRRENEVWHWVGRYFLWVT